MAVDFIYCPPDQIQFLPHEAINYLQEAIDRTPASTSRLDVTLDIAKKGYGGIYLIRKDNSCIGAAYLLSYDTKEGKVLSPVLLGGKDMDTWEKDWWNFVYNMAKGIGAKPVRFIARKGWKKKFPECRVIGYIYEYIIS